MIQIGEKKQAGFDDPLGMLHDCHRRIERFLAVLTTAARERRGQELNEQERRAFKGALEYFQSSGPRHTADEEESLFPRMQSAGADISSLQHDHVAAEPLHAEVDQLGWRWLQQGVLSDADAARLVELTAALTDMYKGHIALEDNEIFPAAARALDKGALGAIGKEMAERRGLAYKSS